MKKLLFILSIITILIFTQFSYYVAKEKWTRLDFDTTVKLQDHLPKRFDDNLSIFSLLGSAEVTVGFCLIVAFLALIKLRWLKALGWLMVIPASSAELFGKLILFHPGPPVMFHRTTLATQLPSFYVHTEFSYPSGHMARASFVITVFCVLIFFSKMSFFPKYALIGTLLSTAFLMGLTRISLGEHWLSDVLGGSLLGIGMGFFATVLILARKFG